MRPDSIAIPCSIVRGGTSKAVFIHQNELPADPAERDALIRAIFGSPDLRQIDGLGGADVLTSKLAIIAPSASPSADVDYTFGQVSFEAKTIDYKGACGNISSAVGPFAIDEGLVAATDPLTTVRIRQTHSGAILVAEVPTKDGRALIDGDCAIDGVPGTGARISMDWTATVGGSGGDGLPTGRPKEAAEFEGKSYEISLVEAGNPLVFIKAASLGLKGTEAPSAIEGDKELMRVIEGIRGVAAVRLGLSSSPERAAMETPYSPFFAIVSPPAGYVAIGGREVKAEDVDLVARLLFMLRMHKAYPITGTVCTGAAMRIPGTVPWECARGETRGEVQFAIGHPSGRVTAEAKASVSSGRAIFERLAVYRTARRIMDGLVYVKKSGWRDR